MVGARREGGCQRGPLPAFRPPDGSGFSGEERDVYVSVTKRRRKKASTATRAVHVTLRAAREGRARSGDRALAVAVPVSLSA